MAQLVTKLTSDAEAELKDISQLPPDANYTFDDHQPSPVIKTSCREVVTVTYSTFRAREVVRHFPKDTSLSIIVPSGSRYEYDIISAVGLGSFIAGKKLSAFNRN